MTLPDWFYEMQHIISMIDDERDEIARRSRARQIAKLRGAGGDMEIPV